MKFSFILATKALPLCRTKRPKRCRIWSVNAKMAVNFALKAAPTSCAEPVLLSNFMASNESQSLSVQKIGIKPLSACNMRLANETLPCASKRRIGGMLRVSDTCTMLSSGPLNLGQLTVKRLYAVQCPVKDNAKV